MARFSRTTSSALSTPTLVPSFTFGAVVILSTMSREGSLSPFVTSG